MSLKSFRPKDINGKELRAIEFLAAFDARLNEFNDALEERLRKTPDGWRNYRLARTCAEKAIDAVYASVDDETRFHMRNIADSSEVIIRPVKRAVEAEMQLVDSNMLKVLVNTSMSAECSICIKEGSDIRKCPLRKSLMFIAPPSRIPNNGKCPYSEIALCHDLGTYME